MSEDDASPTTLFAMINKAIHDWAEEHFLQYVLIGVCFEVLFGLFIMWLKQDAVSKITEATEKFQNVLGKIKEEQEKIQVSLIVSSSADNVRLDITIIHDERHMEDHHIQIKRADVPQLINIGVTKKAAAIALRSLQILSDDAVVTIHGITLGRLRDRYGDGLGMDFIKVVDLNKWFEILPNKTEVLEMGEFWSKINVRDT